MLLHIIYGDNIHFFYFLLIMVLCGKRKHSNPCLLFQTFGPQCLIVIFNKNFYYSKLGISNKPRQGKTYKISCNAQTSLLNKSVSCLHWEDFCRSAFHQANMSMKPSQEQAFLCQFTGFFHSFICIGVILTTHSWALAKYMYPLNFVDALI